MYAGDNDDRIPPNDNDANNDRNRNWVRGWLDLNNSPDNTNTVFLTDSLLGSYLNYSLGVWKCPGDRSTSTHGGRVYPRVRSVSINTYLNCRPPDLPPELEVFRKTGDINAPAGIFVVIDEREESIQNCQFLPSMDGIYPRDPSQFGWVNWPAYYHNGASGLNFADGHSEIRKWRDPRTTPPKGEGGARTLDNPVRTKSNEDSYWLGIRTTGLK